MKIIGFNLLKISIERKEKIEGELKTDQNIDIKEITEEKIPITKESTLKIRFQFNINYSNDFAKLSFEGFLIILPEKEELKNFLESWKKQKLPEDSKIQLFNFLMHKCNIKALALEDELALPTNMRMPRIDPHQTKDLD